MAAVSDEVDIPLRVDRADQIGHSLCLR